jgi:cystathionine beta-lyase family protein involved in aluminum resistance
LRSAIGIEGNYPGSLIDFGIKYEEVDLKSDGTVDLNAIENTLDESYKMVYIQRSRGYSLRPTLTCGDIENIVKAVRKVNKDVIIMLDNCYGEFIEKKQPLSVGVDLMAGSLIKNPGGGISPTGGYIAGRKDLVEMCSYRLTTPGTGKELGATLNVERELFLGAYHAPHASGEALKTAVFASALFKILGYDVSPEYDENRGDIIQVIKLGTPEALEKFCIGIQHASAVDSFVTPYPDDMPGYEDKVIMAAGAFTLGSSIELSADAPLREPYAVWMQGSLNFHAGKLGVMLAANEILS